MMEATRALQKASLKTQIYNKQAKRLKYMTGSMNFCSSHWNFYVFYHIFVVGFRGNAWNFEDHGLYFGVEVSFSKMFVFTIHG